jgi:putative addiction module component (TIGR02574 family)
MTAAELLEQALKLPREEQMKLAHDLWVEADGPYEDPSVVEAAWGAEIGRRLERILDGSDPGLPDTEVRRRFGL